MTTNAPNASRPLTREERSVWWEAFHATLRAVVGRNGNLVDRSADKLIELAEEMAWKALDAYRRAIRGNRP